jgi:hypothetical protein
LIPVINPDFDGISRKGVRPFRTRGVASLRMNSHQPNVERAEALLKKKQERLREGQLAMAEYQADGRAVREKTARLRALRLARDAAPYRPGEVTEKPPAVPTKATKAKKRPAKRLVSSAA